MDDIAPGSGGFLTLGEAAKVLGVRPDSLRTLANEGRIACVRRESPCSPKGERLFRRETLSAYRAKQVASLRAQLERYALAEAAERGAA